MTDPILVRAPGGRTLGAAEFGDPAGTPVFFLHGTPGSRLRRPPNEDDVRAAGLRLITYDRPGYGASDRHPGRRVVDCVPDVTAIADALGIGQFHIAGGSGGGPHTLAAAARLPERVLAADCLVSPAPRDAPGLDFFDGMDPENVREFGWVALGEEALHRELERDGAEILASMGERGTLGDFELSAADREVMGRSDMKQMLLDMVREALRPGVGGWGDDDVALLAPWGFDVSEITVPVTIRYGETDVLVPAGHGEWLARHVPGARVVVDREGGHLVTPEAHLAMLVELVRG